MRLTSILAALVLVAAATAPAVAAQGGVPGGPCQLLCQVVIVLVQLFASCATGEIDQTVYGEGAGGWCTNPVQAVVDCVAETAKGLAGLGPGCA